MGLFSRLFGQRGQATFVRSGQRPPAARGEMRTTTVDRPFRIDTPKIGFLNLRGCGGEAIAQGDRQALSSLFADCRDSDELVPQCQVLFIYCDVAADGRVVGRQENIRDLVKAAGAYLAVVASENAPEHYLKSLGPGDGWHANIILTINRKGEKFAATFKRLFQAMFMGRSMLTAWVEMAPQIPGYDHPDMPEAIMLAEAGHLVFGSGG